MIFWMGTTSYAGRAAVDVVREMERDAAQYPRKGGPLREFLAWSLLELSDRLPLRELEVCDRLSDETLALSYLYLLEQYGLGNLDALPGPDERSLVGPPAL